MVYDHTWLFKDVFLNNPLEVFGDIASRKSAISERGQPLVLILWQELHKKSLVYFLCADLNLGDTNVI